MTTQGQVRKAVVELCEIEACVSVLEVSQRAQVAVSDVRKVVNENRWYSVHKSGNKWTVNPKDSKGRVLVCGTWCG